MWERKVKTAKWNGIAFNIQQTTLDDGKRLHVVELPYADEPYIKVMGATAKAVTLEAVFVGAYSLVDANAFVAKLASDPIGSLEHPYLGEMSLVYQTSSQSFSTKKGLVTLSLKFLRQGQAVVLTRTRLDDKPISQLSDDVVDASTAQFVRDVAQASPEEISSLQSDFTRMLNVIKSVANKLTQFSVKLTSLHHQIQDGINAVNTITNAPGAFADHLNAIIKNLVAVLGDRGATSGRNNTAQRAAQSSHALISINADASKMLGSCISKSAVSSHCNNQITVALVLLSDELALIGSDDDVLVLNDVINNIIIAAGGSVDSVGSSSAGGTGSGSAVSVASSHGGSAGSGSASNTVGGGTGFVDGNLINNAINNAIDKIYRNIKTLQENISDRINEETSAASYESLPAVDALNALRQAVIKQSNKIESFLLSARHLQIISSRPLLCIAQSQERSSSDITALNSIAHPLFVRGSLRIPNE